MQLQGQTAAPSVSVEAARQARTAAEPPKGGFRGRLVSMLSRACVAAPPSVAPEAAAAAEVPPSAMKPTANAPGEAPTAADGGVVADGPVVSDAAGGTQASASSDVGAVLASQALSDSDGGAGASQNRSVLSMLAGSQRAAAPRPPRCTSAGELHVRSTSAAEQRPEAKTTSRLWRRFQAPSGVQRGRELPPRPASALSRLHGDAATSGGVPAAGLSSPRGERAEEASGSASLLNALAPGSPVTTADGVSRPGVETACLHHEQEATSPPLCGRALGAVRGQALESPALVAALTTSPGPHLAAPRRESQPFPGRAALLAPALNEQEATSPGLAAALAPEPQSPGISVGEQALSFGNENAVPASRFEPHGSGGLAAEPAARPAQLLRAVLAESSNAGPNATHADVAADAAPTGSLRDKLLVRLPFCGQSRTECESCLLVCLPDSGLIYTGCT